MNRPALFALFVLGCSHPEPHLVIVDAAAPPPDGTPDAGIMTTPGALDPTFGSGGVVTLDLGGADVAGSILVESSGRIELLAQSFPEVGSGAPTNEIVAFTIDGVLDTTFGTNGIAPYAFSGPVIGTGSNDTFYSAESTCGCIQRHRADGSIDPNYVPITLVVQQMTDTGYSLLVDPSGRVLFSGQSSADQTLFVTRFTPTTGRLDTSFGTNGTSTLGVGTSAGLALQSDGSILVGIDPGDGTSAALLRLQDDGSVDPTYTGPAATGTAGPIFGLAVDSADRAVFAMRITNTISLRTERATKGGDVDPTFLQSIVTTGNSQPLDYYDTGTFARPDGGLVMTGSREEGDESTYDGFVLDVDPTGSRATLFGTSAFIAATFLLPSGDILVAGSTSIDLTADLWLARVKAP